MSSFSETAKKIAETYAVVEDEFYPSGSVIFDAVIGGGIPKGSYVEIASESGLGKSTAALHFCKLICAKGKKAVYMDHEQAVNSSQVRGIGLEDFLGKNFLLLRPISFEDAEKVIETFAKEQDIAYIIIDSITAMLPEKLLGKSVSEIEPGLHARYASQFLLKYKSLARKSGITFIFINQMRTKFNFRGVSRQEAAGGNAQKFYMDVRLQMDLEKRLDKVQNTVEGTETVPYGAHVKVWTVKNRYERPFIPGVATIIYGKGISNISAYSRWMEKKGFFKVGNGGWNTVSFNGKEDKVRGEKGFMEWVRANSKEVKEYIEANGGFLLVEDTEE